VSSSYRSTTSIGQYGLELLGRRKDDYTTRHDFHEEEGYRVLYSEMTIVNAVYGRQIYVR